MLQEILQVLLDTFLESLLTIPFLFGAYLLIEYIEHKAGDKMTESLRRSGLLSVPIGAAAGLVPQCGFSMAASNLYAGGVITAGTLVAVFLATSDEALLVLLGNPQSWAVILKLMAVKVVIAVVAGYLFDLLTRHGAGRRAGDNDLCESCGCDETTGIIVPALRHTIQIYLFVLIISAVLNISLYYVGQARLSQVLLTGSMAQPLVAGLVGLIPNCAASVALAQLYLAGGISFGSMVAGLCTSAGMGLMVLFRTNRNIRANLTIMGYLFAVAVIAGMALQIVGAS